MAYFLDAQACPDVKFSSLSRAGPSRPLSISQVDYCIFSIWVCCLHHGICKSEYFLRYLLKPARKARVRFYFPINCPKALKHKILALFLVCLFFKIFFISTALLCHASMHHLCTWKNMYFERIQKQVELCQAIFNPLMC